MRPVLSLARAGEWWEHKLTPLLGTGYATAAFAGAAVLDHAGAFALVLVALVPGAVYVSVLNDLTDVRTDRAAAKRNRATGQQPMAWAVLAGTVAAGTVVAAAAWRDDPLALGLYAAAWIAFTLYSVPPVRLKSRGAAGAFADAAGAHVFPQLLVAAVILAGTDAEGKAGWLLIVGTWSLALGVRGALLHQLGDVAADARAGVHTFARSRPALAHWLGTHVAFPVELAAFAGLLVLSHGWAAVALLAVYALLEGRRSRHPRGSLVVVAPTKDFRVAMHEYYLVFYPLAFLLASSVRHPSDVLVLVIHFALFPVAAMEILREVTSDLRRLLHRVAASSR